MALDYEAWHCKNEAQEPDGTYPRHPLFCPPEGCPLGECAREKGTDPHLAGEAGPVMRQDGVTKFAEDMRTQGVHVGLGNPPTCVTCDQQWPCSYEVAQRLPEDEGDHAPS